MLAQPHTERANRGQPRFAHLRDCQSSASHSVLRPCVYNGIKPVIAVIPAGEREINAADMISPLSGHTVPEWAHNNNRRKFLKWWWYDDYWGLAGSSSCLEELTLFVPRMRAEVFFFFGICGARYCDNKSKWCWNWTHVSAEGLTYSPPPRENWLSARRALEK